ncbi:MAG: ABC transporter ATP-binding protein [Planctomycetia bacterium]
MSAPDAARDGAPAPALPSASTGAVLRRLLAYVLRHRGLVAWTLVSMVALSVIDLLGPEIVKRAVDGPVARKDADGLLWHGLAFLGVLALGGIVRGARTMLSVRAGRVIGQSLRQDVFAHVQRQSLSWLDRHPVGVLTTRVTGDIESIEEFFTSGVAAFFHDLLKIALVVSVLFLIDVQLALHVMLVVPLLVLAGWAFMRRSRRDFGHVRAEVSAANGLTAEALGGVRVTRLFGREAQAGEAFATATARLRDAHLATVRNFAVFFPVVELLQSLAVALALWAAGSRIVGGDLTLGQFLQLWMLVDICFEPVRELSENLNLMLQAVAAGERVFRVADAVPAVQDRPGATVPGPAHGEVELEGVHFAYVPGQPVLRGVSFRVPAGTTAALVGPTGAGKSSVLALVSRAWDVQEGCVRVDGQDVRDWPQQALRRRIAVVLQDVFLFTGSILDNVRLFDPTITRQQVEDACRAVRADRVLARLPGGLDFRVEERGANLSAGERQMVAFARALVRDPAVLVLDEATASIDTETERWIQEGLAALRRGRTTLVVAHRLSTVREADQILVLRRGQLVEQGTHDVLLARDGLYRRLYDLQVRAQDARGDAAS